MLYLQSISALAMVLGLVGLLYWGANKLGRGLPGRSGERFIEVIEKNALGDKKSLMIVRVKDQTFLLGATSQSVTMLSALDWEDTEEQSPQAVSTRTRADAKLTFQKLLEGVR